MQDRYKKIIEECASAQVEWLRESLYENTDWMIDDQDIDDTDYNAVWAEPSNAVRNIAYSQLYNDYVLDGMD